MSSNGTIAKRILMVRLGAMGDILHTLPAAAALKRGDPSMHLTWAVESRWRPLLEGNPFIDRVIEVRRGSAAEILATIRELRDTRYDLAIDFQGLIKSAVTAAMARPRSVLGYYRTQLREPLAGTFYSREVRVQEVHVVDRHLELAAAGGAIPGPAVFPLPEGVAEGTLPEGEFVLASPLAGWGSKQWPLEYYRELGAMLQRELGIPLVLDGPAGSGLDHHSTLAGLIYATRRAAAIVGVDSGPMHLAAALDRPGVAIFGPTDPARNGPYGGSLKVLRAESAVTTYKREPEIADSMLAITPEQVFASLKAQLRIGSPVQ